MTSDSTSEFSFVEPAKQIPGRSIQGASAILLPVDRNDEIVWSEFESHLVRTVEAGLTPAVNMDTGYIHLLNQSQKQQALELARQHARSESGFIAGAFVSDVAGDRFDLPGYVEAIHAIQAQGGTPIIFPSFGLTSGTDDEVLERYQLLARECDQFYALELGQMFAPFGRIFSLNLFEKIMSISNCLGLKHSSLRRDWEWQRLALRDRIRPEFRLMTGNDLAIDMVVYGSDYLLGLSTMAPDLFALRDRMWKEKNGQFWQLNDTLQYLGAFAFRQPVPAYRHSAAQFLKLRGWIEDDGVFPGSPQRPESDREVLKEILALLQPYLNH